MNINNFSSPDEYPVDLLGDIFTKQKELAEKYHLIEKENGFHVGDGLEVGLHDKFGQHRIKDFAWRVTEELMESLEAYREDDKEHCLEELSDALHFMVELCLISGVSHHSLMMVPDVQEPNEDEWVWSPTYCMLDTIYFLGLACNCLKNKPWKQTQMLTDVIKFQNLIRIAFSSLINCFIAVGVSDDEDIYDLYFRKNKVNQFRQESKY